MTPAPVTSALVTLEDPPADPTECVEFLLDLAVDAGRVTDRAAVRDALLERESMGATGVGMGVAIPHARSPAVTAPTVGFARSTVGIDFDAPDGEPATLLVLLLVPESADTEHVDLLSSVSRGLVDPDVRERLATAESETTVVHTLQEVLAQ